MADNVMALLCFYMDISQSWRSDFHFMVMRSMDGVAGWQSGVCTRPFTPENFKPGVSAKRKLNLN